MPEMTRGLQRKGDTEIRSGSFPGYNLEKAGQRQDRMELNSLLLYVCTESGTIKVINYHIYHEGGPAWADMNQKTGFA